MLPVATAPNALVYDASTMKSTHMLMVGFFMNLICVGITNVAINFYGPVIFGFEVDKVPDWAYESVDNASLVNCTIVS